MLAMAMWLVGRDWLVLFDREWVKLLVCERLRRASGMLVGSLLLSDPLKLRMVAGFGLLREALLLLGAKTVDGRLWRETLLVREALLLLCFQDGCVDD